MKFNYFHQLYLIENLFHIENLDDVKDKYTIYLKNTTNLSAMPEGFTTFIHFIVIIIKNVA